MDRSVLLVQRTRGLPEAKKHFQGITGKTKQTVVGERVLLAVYLTAQEICDEAAREARESAPKDTSTRSVFNMQDQVNKRSAPGKDGVQWNMLRNVPDEGKGQLLDTINSAWKDGKFPVDWKHSVVQPIPKPGKPPDMMANLRSISLTSTIGKFLERLVLTRLTYHLEKSDPHGPHFDEVQTGFRPHLCVRRTACIF